jgi:hypothetical protein
MFRGGTTFNSTMTTTDYTISAKNYNFTTFGDSEYVYLVGVSTATGAAI